jgi:preprotein translocase subunit SecD
MRLSLLLPAAALAALALAGGASAGTPRFALFDVHSDLATASHNTFGDVKVWKHESALARRARGATLVRCGVDCTFGAGWLAFSRKPALSAGDVVSAKTHRTKSGWSVVLGLSARGKQGLARFQRQAALSGKTRGVPDALALVLDGTIVSQPLADQIRHGKATVEIPGFSRGNALRVAKLLGR